MIEAKPTIVFLGTYPPRECGIATFTQDLLKYSQKSLGSFVDCKAAALNLSPLDTYKYPQKVKWEIDQNNKLDYLNLAKTINDDKHISGVIIQHEYGIFGGLEGEMLLTFMQKCNKPMLVALHTTLPKPKPKMKSVTAKIIMLANTIVVLTQRSKDIIKTLYPESIGKVFIIPHGIHPISSLSDPKKYKAKLELENRIVLNTFGLLNRGKGIEYVLRALPEVIKKYPTILYLILGETHPVIRRKEGEKYRLKLGRLIKKLGLEKHVKFYDQYFSLPELLEFLKATDIYMATSINPNQTVSGTLSYALGTGIAAISTEFAQAKEIITPEIGRLVPIKDSAAFTKALLDLLGNKKRLKQMHLNAYKMTRPMLWSNVAKEYTKLLTRLVVPQLRLDYLHKMTDDFGLFQFASLSVPNKNSGYTLDDNARALIVCNWLIRKTYTKELETLIKLYLSFIKKCQLTNGSFVNYIGFKDKLPTSQNNEEDIQDSQTRALWALSEVMANQKLSNNIRNQAKRMFLLKLKRGTKLTHLRAMAFAIKSFALALPILPEKESELLSHIKNHADSLLAALSNNSVKSWRWFESDLNYNNALLSESLIIAGDALKNDKYKTQGFLSLEFLISKTFSKTYMPIGHSNWYKNKQKRSSHDQQPEDPASMILALACAYRYTNKKRYKELTKKCFNWFLGDNSLNKSLYDYKNGGCYDGLHPDRVNLNQGAESLVSYLISSFTVSQLH
ncbi:MAG: glycosyltransferase [Candidatus Levyibacteriota bacterium]